MQITRVAPWALTTLFSILYLRSEVQRGRQAVLYNGVWPILRDFKCSSANLETPRILTKAAESDGSRSGVVVDIGLGQDAKETLDAVEAGFTVYSFEMNPNSILKIKQIVHLRNLSARVHFITYAQGPDGWAKPQWDIAPKPRSGGGFAYIFLAGLTDQLGAVSVNEDGNNIGSLGGKESRKKWEQGLVPMLTLRRALPPWVKSILFVKIDTQGWELKVLKGAMDYLSNHRVQYVQFEFSPWLMKRQGTGDPQELLRLLPRLGAVCFDAMGEHNQQNVNRTSYPLVGDKSYYSNLNAGKNGGITQLSIKMNMPKRHSVESYKSDGIGPWEDILCFFPLARQSQEL